MMLLRLRHACGLMASCFILGACSEEGPAEPAAPRAVASIAIAPTDTILSIGRPLQLQATTRDSGGVPVDAEITWRSSRTTVLTVSYDGIVTPLSQGAATVTATVGGLTARHVFLVLSPDIGFTQTSVDLAFDLGDPIPAPAVAPIVESTGGEYEMSPRVESVGYYYPFPKEWLTASLSSTTLPATVRLQVDTVGLPNGSYYADVIVSGTAQIGGTPVALPRRALRVRILVGGYKQVSAGVEGTCALSTGGTAWCWGSNIAGEVGNGTTTPAYAPARIPGHRFTSISQGLRHTCALVASGAAYCWGGSGISQPAPVTGGHQFVDIQTGDNHTCGLDVTGVVRCWGEGLSGRLGTGTENGAQAPTPVATQERYSSVSAGRDFTCALTLDGRAQCWGSNQYGQIGDGTRTGRLVPTPVFTMMRFVQISAGFLHACARTSTGVVQCWGTNATGALGDGTYVERDGPVTVNTTERFVDIQAGAMESAGSTADGRLYWWGGNNWRAPVSTLPSLTFNLGIGSRSLSLGHVHACRIDASSQVYCWGQNDSGQLGLGWAGSGSVGYTRVGLP